MPELPTAAMPSPSVARALAKIEAAQMLAADDVAECLDAIADIISITGQPDAVFAWVLDSLGREHLNQFAAQNHIKLHESRAVDEEHLAKTVIIWTVDGEGMAITPPGQRPAATLLQLREEIAQRAEEEQRGRDFQASVTAGHVESVDAWHARTSTQAGR
jgi:hypothetical protein